MTTANAVPLSLKTADITRFALRAQELQKVKPAIAYWCRYWIVQVIIQKGLHNADDEALQYTTKLMDGLEETKAAHSSDDIITDDIAGKAYVEQFALDTFSRAEKAMSGNKVTAQTAQTFQAAGTFLELLAIWGPLEPEIQQKAKFAKFHALRIIKALKAGDDPNLSNPKKASEDEADQVLPPLDKNDPEVQELTTVGATNKQASVTDVPDEADTNQARLAARSLANESIHPSRAPSVQPHQQSAPVSGRVSPLPPDAAQFYMGNNADVSPISPERRSSTGGNYFPRMPSPGIVQSQSQPPLGLPSAPDSLDIGVGLPSVPQPGSSIDVLPVTLPSAPENATDSSDTPLLPSSQPSVPQTPLDSFQAPPTPGGQPLPSYAASTHSNAPKAVNMPQTQSGPVSNAYGGSSTGSAPTGTYAAPQRPSEPPLPNVVVDEEAMMKAQKHARWAISALNFEDVPTAINEFQKALAMLGAR